MPSGAWRAGSGQEPALFRRVCADARPDDPPRTEAAVRGHAGQRTTIVSDARVVIVLSLLLGIQPVSTDLYLPTLPAISASLGSSAAQTQLTLSALLLAFGGSQLVWGPLSDRFGRRPILLLGLSGYVLFSFASTLVPSIEWLVAARVGQGLALGAPVMCGRAIVRDLYPPVAGARVMSRALTGLGVLACVSAPLGALVAELFGWRAALAATGVFGFGLLLLVWRQFEESLACPDHAALALPRLLPGWGRIVGHPVFRAYALLAAASYCGLFVILAVSSFVFIGEFGLGRQQYGLVLLSNALAYISGTLLCRRLLHRFAVARTVAVGGVLALVGGLGLLAVVTSGAHSPLPLMPPIWVYMMAHGVCQPCGQTGALSPFPRAAGTASALSGCLMMALAFGVGGWVGSSFGDPIQALSWGVSGCSVWVALVAWLLVPRAVVQDTS
ncbi:MAG: multidrug effflux MFS transporter [Zoogloeaceae bacterium]|nr:multidrug effflux MFS transporter [Rhodocyclaceae bacterium]MCP5235470.1 multidrug effflux MFS transporter [Zoogloeaceae bacterium]